MINNPKRRSPTSNAVGTWSLATRVRIRPNSVSSPIAVTNACPEPDITWVPHQAMFDLAPSAVSAARTPDLLSTGKLSPVRADSSNNNAAASRMRASPAMTSPARNTNTSPGTTSSSATSTSAPSRRTSACTRTAANKSSTARTAPRSWMNPSNALAAVIVKMMAPSIRSPSAIDNTVAPSNNNTIGESSWRNTNRHTGIRPGLWNPSPSRRRVAATSADNPSGLDPRRAKTPSSVSDQDR